MNKQVYPKQVIRYVSGNHTPEDEQFVRQWLAGNPARRESLEELRKVWELSGKLDLGDADRAWSELSSHTINTAKPSLRFAGGLTQKEKKTPIKTLHMFFRVAAMLLIIAGAYGFYQYLTSVRPAPSAQEELVWDTVSSEKGEQVRFRFNDGTKVILNASSQIRYRNDYGKKTRDIYLEGEAYFEVNNEHVLPFVVYTNGVRIEDISTKFDIKAYSEQEETEVVVSEGKVRVSVPKEQSAADSSGNADKEPSVIVSQGQKVNVGYNKELHVQKADLHHALSWLHKRLVFDSEPLKEVAMRLERYFDIEVEITDASLYEKRLTASFEGERMENVLKVLALSMNAEYSLNDDKVSFSIKQETPSINKRNK